MCTGSVSIQIYKDTYIYIVMDTNMLFITGLILD
jgi:hypothetical protein